MQKAPPTPKGFRDIGPQLAKKRREVINKIVDVLEESGFEPIETPTIEFADTLTGKYGEEERLIYKFTDRGGRDLALRYDLTVPLARYVATYNPPLPFRRYQIGQVFRGENPQHGRYREFTQLDFDTVGSNSLEEDAKIIETAIKSTRKLGLKGFQIKINHKQFIEREAELAGVKSNEAAVLKEIDKIGKKPQAEILQSIVNSGNSYVSAATIAGPIESIQAYSEPGTARMLKQYFRNYTPPQGTNIPPFNEKTIKTQLAEAASEPARKEIFEEPEEFKQLEELLLKKGVREEEIAFERKLIRGLDYYTGFIFELKPSKKIEDLTIGSGGRYDNLIGMFKSQKTDLPAGRQVPAVGFSFGLDRLIECLDH